MAAAGVVAWIGEAWPAHAVAAVIALLFLHSAWHIMTNALAEIGNGPAPHHRVPPAPGP